MGAMASRISCVVFVRMQASVLLAASVSLPQPALEEAPYQFINTAVWLSPIPTALLATPECGMIAWTIGSSG